MAKYNKTLINYLNFNQKVVTITTGNDIGINNILQQIQANFDDIQFLLDPTQNGGGLSTENIRKGGITSESLTISSYKFENAGAINDGNYLTMGSPDRGAVSPSRTFANGSFTVTHSKNVQISVRANVNFQVANGTNTFCGFQIFIDISNTPSFTTFRTLYFPERVPPTGDIWNNLTIGGTQNEPFDSGVYYIRAICKVSGNTGVRYQLDYGQVSIVIL